MIFEFSGLLNLIPEETDDLLQRIDQPLTEETDQATVRFFAIDRFSFESSATREDSKRDNSVFYHLMIDVKNNKVRTKYSISCITGT